MLHPLLFIKPVLIAGLAFWLSTACFNNIVDRATNRYFLRYMLNITILKEDALLGKGLLARSWKSNKRVSTLLWGIVGLQAAIAISLWSSAILLSMTIFDIHYLNLALHMANWSLLGFMIFWLWFLCGGLWFGYWIKMSHVQITHLLLLTIALLSMIVINLPLEWSLA